MVILQVLQWAEKMGRRLMRSHGNQLPRHWDVTYKKNIQINQYYVRLTVVLIIILYLHM